MSPYQVQEENERRSERRERLISKPLLVWGGGVVILAHAAIAGVLWYFTHPIENVVVLRYNVYLGVSLLGAKWQIFLLPAVSFFFCLLNFFLILWLVRRGRHILTLLLYISMGMVTLATAIASSVIAFINY